MNSLSPHPLSLPNANGWWWCKYGTTTAVVKVITSLRGALVYSIDLRRWVPAESLNAQWLGPIPQPPIFTEIIPT